MDFTESDIMDKEDEAELCPTELDVPLAHLSAAQGNVDGLTEAIKADPTMLEQQDTEGLTPIAHAVMGEKIESVKLLVKIGASLNAQDTLGRTCLSMAAYQGWNEGVVFLLRNGAKQNIPEKCGRTALHSATYPTDTKVLSALLQTVTEDDISMQDYEGMTALHWACFHNRPTHAQLLLLKGSDPFMQDMDGRTPLHWACQNGSLECVTVLVHIDTSKTLVNVPDFSGKSPMHFAAAAGHSDVIRELVSVQSTDLQAEDNDERTPLHWAAASGQAEALKTLLDLGVDPNPVDVDEGTPLDYARQSGHKECVRVLEERLGLISTDLKAGDENGKFTNTADTNNKTKTKNPFGFIVDLFRPRAGKVVETKSDSDYRTAEREISDGSLETECGGNNIEELRAMNSSNLQQQGSSSVPNSRLSTPVKRQRDSEVLRSMEMIHLSREDNPVLQKIRNSEQNLGDVHHSHGSLNLVGDMSNKTRHKSADNSGSESPINQFDDILIRSPPPVIKRQHSPLSRENSLSPVPSTAFSGRSEYTRAKIENDAAEILALHNQVLGSQTSTPRSHISRLSSDESPRLQGSPLTMSEEDVPIDKDVAYGRKIRLAPLKGPVPRQLSPGQLLNKHLDNVRQESRESRTPTPPPQSNSSSATVSSSSSSSHTSPKLDKRKKKRKNNSMGEVSDNSGLNDTTTDYSSNILSVVEKEQEEMSSPRLPTPLEQRKAIDKSIRTLLQ